MTFIVPNMNRIILLFLLALAISTSASGYEFREPGIDEKMAVADLVAIGKVLSIEGADEQSVRVKSVLTLKGEISGDFSFLYTSHVAEMSSDCCHIGKLYIFFLRKNDGGFIPLRGRKSILLIDGG